MLELGRERTVAGNCRPAVFEHLHVRAADIDHWLDGEDHARFELGAGSRPAGVDDLGTVMEHAPDTVAAEIANDAVTARLRVALDGVGDVPEVIAGFCLLKA